MAVWALGINHVTAPLNLRERFAFATDQLAPLLHGLRNAFAVQPEAAIISTCNRTEVYCAGGELDLEPTIEWLARSGAVASSELRQHAYAMQDHLVARHAFRVASGLDSMVLGEPQILGQMKDAVRAAEQAGTLGTTLNQLFQRSFAVAKEVRTSTAIGEHSISMTAAAVRLAGQLFEDLKQTRIVFIGAGEMIELALTHFAARSPSAMAVANRTYARGEQLASRFGAKVMRLADLPERLHEFDIVVSCTASTLPIIGLGSVKRALRARKHRPMFMVDLAVPRDIESDVKALDDVFLYTVDDLASVVHTGHAHRRAAVAQAEAIIDAGVSSFVHWMEQRGSVPLIQRLNAQTEAWRLAELAKANRLLAKGESVEQVLDALSRSLSQKMLHGAYAELHSGDPASRERASDAIEHFFLRQSR